MANRSRVRKNLRKQKNKQRRLRRKRLSNYDSMKARSNVRDERSVHDRLGYNIEKGMFPCSDLKSGVSPLNRNGFELFQNEPRYNVSVKDRLGYIGNGGIHRNGSRSRMLNPKAEFCCFQGNRQSSNNLYGEVDGNRDQTKPDMDGMYVVVDRNQFQPMADLQDMYVEMENDPDWTYNADLGVYSKSNLKIYPAGIFHFEYGIRYFRSETFQVEHVDSSDSSEHYEQIIISI